MRASRSAASKVADRRDGNRGQILVVFAIALVGMLATAGLLIDSGLASGNRRQAQTAADTGALAAMRAMADDAIMPDPYDVDAWAAAAVVAGTSAANAMSASNGFPSGSVSCPGGASAQGVVVNQPPQSGPHTLVNDPTHAVEYVEVITTRAMETTFSGVVGQKCWLVSARAVAHVVPETDVTEGEPFPAILAGYGPSPCSDGAVNNSARFHVIGDVISNSGIHDSSHGTIIDGDVTYVDNPPNVCGTHMTQGLDNPPGWIGEAVDEPTGWPKAYTLDGTAHTITNDVTGETAPCTFWFAGSTNLGDGPWWVGGNSSSDQLLPGIYCANGSIGLSNNGTVGNVTFVSFSASGNVTSSAGNANLTAYWDNLLGYTNRGGATTMVINYSGSGAQWTGLMFAPNGQVQVSGGNNLTQNAALWGQTVHTSGTDWSLDSTTLLGPTESDPAWGFGTLVE